MTTYTMSPYQGHDQDAAAVLVFLSKISRHPRFIAEYHVGDFVWQGYRDVPTPWLDRLAIWRDPSGEIAAVAFFEDQNGIADIIHPALIDTPDFDELFAQIVAWEERHPVLRGDSTDPLGITTLDVDTDTDLLERHGFRYSGKDLYAYHMQELDGSIPEPVLPEGYEIVAMTDDADLVQRVEIHREVWAPSKFTLEGYRRHRAAPIYRQDLDLVVRGPDGRYAAYLIAWLDSAAKTGLFEPVGARADYRRLGLTRSLIYETLRRLRNLGAERAYVGSIAEEGPARALYRAAGFTTIGTWQWWERPAG